MRSWEQYDVLSPFLIGWIFLFCKLKRNDKSSFLNSPLPEWLLTVNRPKIKFLEVLIIDKLGPILSHLSWKFWEDLPFFNILYFLIYFSLFLLNFLNNSSYTKLKSSILIIIFDFSGKNK